MFQEQAPTCMDEEVRLEIDRPRQPDGRAGLTITITISRTFMWDADALTETNHDHLAQPTIVQVN